ncbi:hypothetical protein [Acinetobacter sp. CE-15]|uniref:hypothetical protein n=1 Tax=Acinetobacter sp. CE-15 TaxID=3425693 RepID=UPI003DA3D673
MKILKNIQKQVEMMSNNFKWIFLYGGLGWGLSMATFMSVLRWIEYKSPAFGSLPIFFVVCVVCGIGWGFFINKLDKEKKNLNIIFPKLIKSLLLLVCTLCIYGLVFRYILVPKNLNNTFISTLLLFLLLLLPFSAKKFRAILDKV